MNRSLRVRRGLRGTGLRFWAHPVVRRFPAVVALGALVAGASILPGRVEAAPFGFADVATKARQLAASSFEDPRGRVPDWLLEISYDQWRDIRFRPERALWRGDRLPFSVQFFHPGLFYDRPVKINVVDRAGAHPVEFSPSSFDYGQTNLGSRVPQDLGYAGFRLHHPIKTPAYHDEVIVFLGASYFRGVGRRQRFGASARGLAIDTALPSGEEFPYFREFWLLRPAPAAAEIEILALLDSPSLTGAYRFVVRPGEETLLDVTAKLYRRADVRKLGLAPLTSMFYYGENTTRQFDDFRPEVHDSDGLLVQTGGGEWIWRPLDNPSTLRVGGVPVADLRGFGFFQRDRNFDHYQDLETRPDERPSAWVVPRGSWGAGRIELVEIPTHADTNDNVVAYWVPNGVPAIDQPIELGYRIHWFGDAAGRPPLGQVLATRTDHDREAGTRRFVVDFGGGQLARIPNDAVLRAVISIGGGAERSGDLLEQVVLKNLATDGWRLVFRMRPSDDGPVEVRAVLQLKDETLTETWSYLIAP